MEMEINNIILKDIKATLPLQHQQLLQMTTHSNYVTKHQNVVVQLQVRNRNF